MSLPFEVLEQIFPHCLSSDTFITPRINQAPLLLTQICSGWRQVALSVPWLWSSLSLQGSLSPQATAFILEIWLDRSHNCPVSLSISRDLLQHSQIAALFARCSPRWKNIATSIHSSDTAPWESRLIREPLNCLETFNLTVLDGLSAFQARRLTALLRSAPHLSRVVWRCNRRAHVPLPNIDWSRFTDVQISGYTDWAHFFTHGQNLIHFVHGNICTTTLPLTLLAPDNALQHLRTLVMHADEECLDLLYSTLTLPSLESLEVYFNDSSESPRVARSLHGLLERSQCPLETLDLYDHPLTEASIIQILRCVQGTLRELTIQLDPDDMIIVGDAFFDLLSAVDPATPCLCPKLVSLALYECIRCAPGAFAKMIQSRQVYGVLQGSSVSPIQLVELYEDDGELKYLKPLRAEGLIIKVYPYVPSEPLPIDPEEETRLQRMYENGFPQQRRHLLNS